MIHTLAAALLIALCPATIDVPDLNGQLQEDDPGWSCADNGNRICGPLSDDWGHTPGCYDDAGALVATWPCYVVVDPVTGEGDVYTPELEAR